MRVTAPSRSTLRNPSARVSELAVVYFRLDADRRPLLSQMLAAAIVSDLVTLVGGLEANPVPTVVLVDEFAAVAAEHVARLFGCARSAGVSLILACQELADLKVAADGLRDSSRLPVDLGDDPLGRF